MRLFGIVSTVAPSSKHANAVVFVHLEDWQHTLGYIPTLHYKSVSLCGDCQHLLAYPQLNEAWTSSFGLVA